MNASTRKCTDAKPCQLMNCYACRKRLIDETATAMLVAGTDQDQVDRYRYAAINALAFEIETPKPKAPKATVKPVQINVDILATELQAMSTETGAQALLSIYRVPELRALSRALGLGAQSKLNKGALIESLIHFTVGMKLAHASVLNAK